jgi:hypothetical protein
MVSSVSPIHTGGDTVKIQLGGGQNIADDMNEAVRCIKV